MPRFQPSLPLLLLQQALAALRAFYRKSWTRPAMRSVLRTGSHIMVPDDHDLVNAVTCVGLGSGSREWDATCMQGCIGQWR